MRVDPETDLAADIERLSTLIDRAAEATAAALAYHWPASPGDDPRSLVAEHEELHRQLVALRERATLAQTQSQNAGARRAELATLLFFARTLLADADAWRATLAERIDELERQEIAARQERERLLAEREKLAAEREAVLRRRAVLQSKIDQTAEQMAKQDGGECRRTLPLVTIGDGVTVCSSVVDTPRRGFRRAQRWLVTLDKAREKVLVTRQ